MSSPATNPLGGGGAWAFWTDGTPLAVHGNPSSPEGAPTRSLLETVGDMDATNDDKRMAGINRRDFMGLSAAAAAVVASPSEGVAPFRAKQTAKKPRWGFFIDLRKCVGCFACTVTCKTENDVPLGVFRNDVKTYESGDYPHVEKLFLPTLCNHCDKPKCIERCPTSMTTHRWVRPDGAEESYAGKEATFQRPDGLVLIDQSACWGCGNCVNACPYGVRFINPTKTAGGGLMAGKLKAADKCDMCVHRLDQGIVPACVNTCQGKARIMGDLNDPLSEISQLIEKHKDEVQVLMPEAGTGPQCYYIGAEDLQAAYKGGKGMRDEVREA